MLQRIVPKTLTELYRKAAEAYGERPAFARRGGAAGWETISFTRLYERGLDLAEGFVELGLRPREHVAVFADNCLEWILTDYGVLLAGGADVPRGADSTPAEMKYIAEHSDARLVVAQNAAVLEKLESAGLPRGVRVVVMHAEEAPPRGALLLAEVEKRGRESRARGSRRAEEAAQSVQPGDLFTIIYTSGTTGTPKGVQLTHAAMASQIRNLPFSLYPGERALSILPVWHSYERVFEMVAISMGVCTYYTSLRTLAEDLKSVRPHVMASAPRLWESLYQKLMARVQQMPAPRRALFHLARKAGCAVHNARRFFRGQELDMHGRSLPESIQRGVAHALRWMIYSPLLALLEPVVLLKLREAVGCGEFRGTISGGGALQAHVDEFFNSIGIPVLEGYGLTESCPVLAVRTWDNLVIGTVGPPYPETEIRIADLHTGEIVYPDRSRRDGGRGRRGEILARGPQLMKGYYKDPEGTARVLREGWLHTGDIGMMTFNGCLKILGRCKDTIVLLNGENVEPVPIENRLTASPLIEACMVTGQDEKHLGALVVPSLEGFRAAGVPAASLAELAEKPAAQALLEKEIRSLVSAEAGFKPFERIACFRMLPKPFEVGQELTATLKLRRHVIAETYAALIREMHRGESGKP